MFMYKTVCVAVLLLPTFALAQAYNPAPLPFASPLIVAKGKLVNQTAPIPTTTIITPPQSGLFRLSVYATLTKSDSTSDSSWLFNVAWTDDSGVESTSYGEIEPLSTGGFAKLGSFIWSGVDHRYGATLTFEAAAGTSVSYYVHQQGNPDNSSYSLYYTLERLE
jgi:hypothetical protein